ncbi:hypothetical protein Tco_1367132 [Tanacetum coccineum]
MKEEDAYLDEIQPSETKNSEEYDLSFKFMMIIEPSLPPICFTHKQRRDLSIWTTAAGMANDLFTDDSFVVILGEEVDASKVTIFDNKTDLSRHRGQG